MVRYSKFQFGWLIVTIYVAIIIWMTFAYLNQWGNHPVNRSGYILFLIIFGGILLNFCGMTVIVTDTQIRIKLGIGLYTTKINLSDVASARGLTYPLYCGFGIRLIRGGKMYNVSGRHAVEIRFRNAKKIILIGSADWQNLLVAIEKGIQK
jgi:hypothetical protein